MVNKSWKYKEGHTVIVEGAGDLLVRNFPKKSNYSVRWIEATKTFLFGRKKENRVDLWCFGQYNSWVLPSDLHAVFCGMIPEGTELVRPEPAKKERVFEKGFGPK